MVLGAGIRRGNTRVHSRLCADVFVWDLRVTRPDTRSTDYCIRPMTPDPALNEKHATDPQRGDYWHEMFCPAFVVLARLGNRVVFCDKVKKTDASHWTWDLDGGGVKMLTVEEFRKRLQYATNPHYWCDVSPQRHKGVADHFDQINAPVTAPDSKEGR